MVKFTKEHLLDIRKAVGEFVTRTERDLAAFALTLMERAESAEAERDRLLEQVNNLRNALDIAKELIEELKRARGRGGRGGEPRDK